MANRKEQRPQSREFYLPLSEEQAQSLQTNDIIVMSATTLMDLITGRQTLEYTGVTRVDDDATLTVTVNHPSERKVSLSYRNILHEIEPQLEGQVPPNAMGILTVSYDDLVGLSLENVFGSVANRLKKFIKRQ